MFLTMSARPLAVIRIAFFLCVMADSFGNAFLPILARGLANPFPGVSEAMAAGLPVSAFWFMVAVAQVTVSWWERGRDHRMLFIGAAGLSAAALVLAGLSGTVIELTVWRGVGGFGHGVVMMLAQDMILRIMPPSRRTLASGVYLSVFFGGMICGAAAGGAVAEWIGQGNALMTAAALAAVGALVALALDSHRETTGSGAFPLETLGNRRFLALALFAAIPSRLLIGAFLYYLIPLHLHDIGASRTEIGWIVMIYAAIIATTATFWSRLVDRTARPLGFTIAGVALSAAAMLVVPAAGDGVWAAAWAVALLGLAQAIGMSPQVTVLFQVAAAEMARFGRTPLLGIFRVSERIGLFLGPMVAAALMGGLGYEGALGALAAVTAVAALALTVALSGRRPADAQPIPPDGAAQLSPTSLASTPLASAEKREKHA